MILVMINYKTHDIVGCIYNALKLGMGIVLPTYSNVTKAKLDLQIEE